jgi:hypothetical protein
MMLVRIVDRAAMCPDCAGDCLAVDELLRAIGDVAEARTAEDVLAVLVAAGGRDRIGSWPR